MKRSLFVACLGGAALLVVLTAAIPGAAETEAPATPVPYPEGFRRWAHVKTGLVTAASPQFAVAGGFHHIYANGPALAGYASGSFADGSVIVFDRIAVEDGPGGTLKEGQRVVVDVMQRDATKYAETGGWGFEEFAGSSTTQRNVGSKAKATCFNCHSKQSPGSFVVSTLRE